MTRQLPLLGHEAIDSHTGLCGFISGLPGVAPIPPSCLADAEWHGFVLTEDGTGLVSRLSACTEHKNAMALTADHVHEYGTACSIDEATMWWDGPTGASGCRIDWDVSALGMACAVPAEAAA